MADGPGVTSSTVGIGVISLKHLLESVVEDLPAQKQQHKWPYVKSRQSHATTIDAIVRAVTKERQYFMCNFHHPTDTSTLHEDIRQVIQLRLQHVANEWWEHTYYVQDAAKATLWVPCGLGSDDLWI